MSRSDPSQRLAAAAFLAATAPLAIAIAQAGGVVALLPLALLVLPILAIGRAPGVARLQARAARARRRQCAVATARPPVPANRRVAGGLLIAVRLSNRAPPLACRATA
ncbi:MAG TPA: hypothetical protein VFH44_09155 [Solirubrobacterales bacterium]|nr:hypothetical protein [Solirubrobacterales bacterium]